MNSSAVSQSHGYYARVLFSGGLPRSAASYTMPRPYATTARATKFKSVMGPAFLISWLPAASAQRLPPANAVTRDPPKGAGAGDKRSPTGQRRTKSKPRDAAPSPPPPTSHSQTPPPQSPKPKASHRKTQRRQANGPAARPPPPPPPRGPPPNSPVHVGQQLELSCARLALEGKGVCLLPPTGFVVLVERTLPGELVVAEVVSVKRGYAEARKLASLSPHRHAVQAPCPYFGPCGGCTLQSLQYEAQLAEKRNQVEQTLRRVGRLGPSLDILAAEAEAAAARDGGGGGGGGGVSATVGCRETYAYRNKMMFHFSAKCWLAPGDDVVEDRPCLGLLRPGTADVVLPVVRHGCKLQGAEANALLARVEELVSEAGLLPYNHSTGKGVLKHVVIRTGSGAATSAGSAAGEARELMLVLGVTHGLAVKQLRPVAEALGREFRSLVSVAAHVVAPPQPLPPSRGGGGGSGGGSGQARNSRQSQSQAEGSAAVADGGGDADADDIDGRSPVTLLYGTPYLHDVLGGLTFRISPGSFFQTNSQQAEVLYDVVRRAAGLRPGAVDTVLDLYCGTGTIGLSLASECRRVVGVEVLESAVEDARANAALNAISNVEFLCADVDTFQRTLTASANVASAAVSPSTTECLTTAVPTPDVVIVDPARGGLSLDAASFLSRCGARRVVYVSCNVATQARDLDRLCNGSGAPFRLASVQPVDMFPHTDHVETVAVLDRRDVAATA